MARTKSDPRWSIDDDVQGRVRAEAHRQRRSASSLAEQLIADGIEREERRRRERQREESDR